MVAEALPASSDAVPLIGKLAYTGQCFMLLLRSLREQPVQNISQHLKECLNSLVVLPYFILYECQMHNVIHNYHA